MKEDTVLERINWTEPEYLGLEWKPNKFQSIWKELTRDEFDMLRDHGAYGLIGINYESVVPLPGQPETMGVFGGYQIHYYFYPHYALAIADRYMIYREYDSPKFPAGKGDFLPKKLNKVDKLTENTYGYARRYFRIGCEHKWKELGQKECREKGIAHWGICWHVEECQKCGMRWSYDSSG